MNEKKYSTLGLIAVILQGIAVLGAACVIVFQRALLPFYTVSDLEYTGLIIPVAVIFMVLDLVIYIVFLLHSSAEGHKALVIVLIVVSALLTYISFVSGFVGTMIYSRMGEAYLVAYSGVSSLISFTTLLTSPAVVLFYVACGRYTARKGA